MAKIKEIGMAAGTFGVALGIGFVMQNGDALASRFGSENAPDSRAVFTAEASDEAPIIQASLDVTPEIDEPIVAIQPARNSVVFTAEPALSAPMAQPEELALVPESAESPEVVEAPVLLAHAQPDVIPDVPAETTVAEAALVCVPTMIAEPAAAATVSLAVSAPCHTNTEFTIHHQGMMFTETTDEDGVAKVTVPALSQVAVMIASFGGGEGAVATTLVEDFAEYDRAVLQWQGGNSVMLSAYEGGAEFGDPGHINAANLGNIERLTLAEGGYMMRLGDESAAETRLAEVYTFPAGQMGEDLEVMIVAEAEVTAENCGQELSAQSIQVSPGAEPTALDLTMVMPACDTVGDFLILQNMFKDQTLASR